MPFARLGSSSSTSCRAGFLLFVAPAEGSLLAVAFLLGASTKLARSCSLSDRRAAGGAAAAARPQSEAEAASFETFLHANCRSFGPARADAPPPGGGGGARLQTVHRGGVRAL